MTLKTVCATVGALACIGAVASDAAAQRFDPRGRDGGRDVWVELGCQSVGFRVDRDAIRVGRQEGRFRAIRLRASGAPVHLLDLRVVYANGEPDDLQVRSELVPGRPTRPLDLRGWQRSISHIELIYRARPTFAGRARVCAEGLQAVAEGPGPGAGPGPIGPGPGRWVLLGCKSVTFRVDRDVIPVGRQEGRFRAIRLRASGGDVHMLDLKVIYANGAPDDIPVRSVIRSGSQTGPLDLRGRERSIDRIELLYQSRPSFRGQARVCAEGLD